MRLVNSFSEILNHTLMNHPLDLNVEQPRRVSVQIGATSASMAQQQAASNTNTASSAVKGNFVVSQSDLWDTHTLNAAKQRQSPRHHPNPSRCQHGHMAQQQQMQLALQQQQQQMNTSNSNLSTEQSPSHYGSVTNSPSGHMQRSVSEKNRSKHRHKPNKMSVMCQSETDSEREQRDVGGCGGGGGQIRKLAKTMQQHSHHHSSPNVAPMDRPHHRQGTGSGGGGVGQHHYRSKVDTSTSSIYNACSESELLDGESAIMIRKLLTEREPRYRSRNMVGASCPNISIKCDIVEYL